MHTYKAERTRFSYNGDFSGDILITPEEGDTVKVPAYDLELFLQEMIRARTVDLLEQTTDIRPLALSLLTLQMFGE